MVGPVGQSYDETSEKGGKEISVKLHCLLFHVSAHTIELCLPRLVCVSTARSRDGHAKLTDIRYRM